MKRKALAFFTSAGFMIAVTAVGGMETGALSDGRGFAQTLAGLVVMALCGAFLLDDMEREAIRGGELLNRRAEKKDGGITSERRKGA